MKASTALKQVPALNSPQRQIPDNPSPRCKRATCQGSSCPGWKFCSPTTAFGGVYPSRIAPARVS